MALFFLMIIYAAFISLGLPDSLLGTAWPLMQPEFGVSTESAGIIFMVTAGGTIVSSLFSSRVIRKYGTGNVTFVSILLTAGALFGIHLAPEFYWLPLLAIPLGLGAGAIDAGLNEFIAEHYESRHMSWLHSFWGLGAMTGPIILSGILTSGGSWRSGYLIVSIVQFCIAGLILLTLPMWQKVKTRKTVMQEVFPETEKPQPSAHKTLGIKKLLKLDGVHAVLISFILYCGIEQTMMLWGATYLIQARGFDSAKAAFWISFFLGGITLGRFLSGFITMKLNNTRMIRLGQLLILAGTLLIILPLPDGLSLAGIIIAGLGCAPIYPCMLHETPVRFGKENAQEVMGFQMAAAYIGSTFLPPLMGVVGSHTTMAILPYILFFYGIVMFFFSEQLNRRLRKRQL